jgi:hypothetical protein
MENLSCVLQVVLPGGGGDGGCCVVANSLAPSVSLPLVVVVGLVAHHLLS